MERQANNQLGQWLAWMERGEWDQTDLITNLRRSQPDVSPNNTSAFRRLLKQAEQSQLFRFFRMSSSSAGLIRVQRPLAHGYDFHPYRQLDNTGTDELELLQSPAWMKLFEYSVDSKDEDVVDVLKRRAQLIAGYLNLDDIRREYEIRGATKEGTYTNAAASVDTLSGQPTTSALHIYNLPQSNTDGNTIWEIEDTDAPNQPRKQYHLKKGEVPSVYQRIQELGTRSTASPLGSSYYYQSHSTPLYSGNTSIGSNSHLSHHESMDSLQSQSIGTDAFPIQFANPDDDDSTLVRDDDDDDDDVFPPSAPLPYPPKNINEYNRLFSKQESPHLVPSRLNRNAVAIQKHVDKLREARRIKRKHKQPLMSAMHIFPAPTHPQTDTDNDQLQRWIYMSDTPVDEPVIGSFHLPKGEHIEIIDPMKQGFHPRVKYPVGTHQQISRDNMISKQNRFDELVSEVRSNSNNNGYGSSDYNDLIDAYNRRQRRSQTYTNDDDSDLFSIGQTSSGVYGK